jgi:hypothetical protein
LYEKNSNKTRTSDLGIKKAQVAETKKKKLKAVVINFSIPNFITSTPFKTAAPIGLQVRRKCMGTLLLDYIDSEISVVNY